MFRLPIQYRIRDILVVFAVVAAFLGVLAGIQTIRYARGKFTAINFQRIEVGMTIAEVETLLGSAGAEVSWPPMLNQKSVISGQRYFRWDSGINAIYVSVRNDVVAEKYYFAPSL